MFLVDSVKFIDWQRAGLDPRHVLANYVLHGNVVTCGVVRVEVVRGIRNSEWRHDLEQFFDFVPEIPTGHEQWRAATELAWRLDRQGKVLPLTDIVIGACALSNGATVVTTDPHFWEIPELDVVESLPS